MKCAHAQAGAIVLRVSRHISQALTLPASKRKTLRQRLDGFAPAWRRQGACKGPPKHSLWLLCIAVLVILPYSELICTKRGAKCDSMWMGAIVSANFRERAISEHAKEVQREGVSCMKEAIQEGAADESRGG